MSITVPTPKLSSSVTEVVATIETVGKTGSIYVVAVASTNDPVQQLQLYPAIMPVVPGEKLMIITDQ
ncbi:MAG: hypothetical protein HRU04_10535 [Oceanospirillaceae bacterium]|nr:hypothetical protein [Oceanospirillaceae bacterium]